MSPWNRIQDSAVNWSRNWGLSILCLLLLAYCVWHRVASVPVAATVSALFVSAALLASQTNPSVMRVKATLPLTRRYLENRIWILGSLLPFLLLVFAALLELHSLKASHGQTSYANPETLFCVLAPALWANICLINFGVLKLESDIRTKYDQLPAGILLSICVAGMVAACVLGVACESTLGQAKLAISCAVYTLIVFLGTYPTRTHLLDALIETGRGASAPIDWGRLKRPMPTPPQSPLKMKRLIGIVAAYIVALVSQITLGRVGTAISLLIYLLLAYFFLVRFMAIRKRTREALFMTGRLSTQSMNWGYAKEPTRLSKAPNAKGIDITHCVRTSRLPILWPLCLRAAIMATFLAFVAIFLTVPFVPLEERLGRGEVSSGPVALAILMFAEVILLAGALPHPSRYWRPVRALPISAVGFALRMVGILVAAMVPFCLSFLALIFFFGRWDCAIPILSLQLGLLGLAITIHGIEVQTLNRAWVSIIRVPFCGVLLATYLGASAIALTRPTMAILTSAVGILVGLIGLFVVLPRGIASNSKAYKANHTTRR